MSNIVTNKEFEDLKELVGREENNIPTKNPTPNDTLYINDSADMPLKKFSLKGKTEQLKSTNSQLLPFTNQDFTKNGMRYYVKDGNLYLDGTSVGETPAATQEFKDNFSFTLPAGTYYIKKSIIPFAIKKLSDDTLITNIQSSFTLLEETELYLGFYVYDRTFNNRLADFMLSSGSSMKQYEPYTRKVPAGYTQVDYIKNTDMQYINSGVYFNLENTFKIDLKIKWDSYLNHRQLFGTNARGGYFGINENGYYEFSPTTISNVLGSTDKYDRIIYTFNDSNNSSILNVNGVDILTRTESKSIGHPFIIFNLSDYGEVTSSYSCLANIEYIKIYTGSSLTRDLVPCIRDSDNEIGLYDNVGNNFYSNSGEGIFSKGENTLIPSTQNPSEIKNVKGKNILNVSSTFNVTGYTNLLDKISGLKLNQEYIVSWSKSIKGGNNSPALVFGNGISTVFLSTSGGSAKFKYTSTPSYIYLYSNGWDAQGSLGVTSTIENFMISEEGGDYTPYNHIQVKKCNKNLFDINDFINDMSTHYQGTINIDGKQCIALGRGSSTETSYTFNLKLKENTQYTFSCKYTRSNCQLYFLYSDNTVSAALGDITDTLSNSAIVSAEGKTLIGLKADCYGWYSTGSMILLADVQLEQGTIKTDYIPHQSKIYNFPLLEGQKLYEGSYLAEDGIHHVRGQVIFDGNDNEIWADFSYTSGDSNFRVQNSTPLPNILTPPTNPANLTCNYFIAANRDNAYIKTVVGIAQYGLALGTVFISAPISILSESTMDGWKNWLSTHNVIVEYLLAEEEIVPYTQEQQAVYDEIIKDGTYKLITHYSSNALLNPNMDLTYRRDLNTAFDNLDNRLTILED